MIPISLYLKQPETHWQLTDNVSLKFLIENKPLFKSFFFTAHYLDVLRWNFLDKKETILWSHDKIFYQPSPGMSELKVFISFSNGITLELGL